jgi:thiamine-monophosphate kinase
MKLSRLGEFGLIERVRRIAPTSRDVRLGIGDDAAWVRAKTDTFLVTADLLIEGVHFNLDWTSLFDLGYKTLAVNLSDIAAMGGTPAYVVISLGIPRRFRSTQIEDFYKGIRSLASEHKVAVVGGDTSVADCLIISACLMGHAPYQPITRSGAEVTNDIYVTGTLGDSALGFELLKNKPAGMRKDLASQLITRHHKPTPRVAVGSLLARERLATAMIDVSDGLLQDLGHIAEASGIGATVWEERLPISRAYHQLEEKHGRRYALTGGEDYELLFCARRSDRRRIEKLQGQTKVPIARIGTCVSADEGILVLGRSGEPVSFPAGGHDHFKKQPVVRNT